MTGHSIQCRVTTEDPFNNFQPDTGAPRARGMRGSGWPG